MSVCVHDIECPGSGPEHDWATTSYENLITARRAAKAGARSKNPAKSGPHKQMLARVQAALNVGLELKRAEEES